MRTALALLILLFATPAFSQVSQEVLPRIIALNGFQGSEDRVAEIAFGVLARPMNLHEYFKDFDLTRLQRDEWYSIVGRLQVAENQSAFEGLGGETDRALIDQLTKEVRKHQLEIKKDAIRYFSRMDDDVLLQVIQRANFLDILWNPKRDKSDFSMLLNPRVGRMLDLSEGQKKRIEKLSSVYWKKREKGLSDFKEALAQNQNRRLFRVEAELTTEQRRKFRQAIGTPIKVFLEDYGLGNEFQYPEGLRVVIEESKPKSPFVSKWGATNEQGVPEYYDRVWWHVMKAPLVVRELELSQSQRRELVSFRNKVSRFSKKVHFGHRVWWLIEGEASQPKELDDILLPQQIEALNQLEVQISCGANINSFGLLHPTMANSLNLNEDQKTAIAKIVVESETEKLESEVKYFEQLESYVNQAYEEVLGCLGGHQLELHGSILPRKPIRELVVPQRIKSLLMERQEQPAKRS